MLLRHIITTLEIVFGSTAQGQALGCPNLGLVIGGRLPLALAWLDPHSAVSG